MSRLRRLTWIAFKFGVGIQLVAYIHFELHTKPPMTNIGHFRFFSILKQGSGEHHLQLYTGETPWMVWT